jgi:hypothetical protein
MKLTIVSNSLLCLFLGHLSLAQAAAADPLPAARPASQSVATAAPSAREQGDTPDNSEKPLITIKGLCDHSAATAKAECKTVITRGQFEALVNAIDPSMSRHARREFAQEYADGLVMAAKAEQMGLDKGPNYEERMQFARIEVLSQTLKKKIAAESENLSDKDIGDFYRRNVTRFEKAEFERVYLPRGPESALAIAGKPSEAGSDERLQGAEETRRNEAKDLHARALKGEAFDALQADAYAAAGIRSSPPGTTLSVRRIALPPDQTSVMDLNPGEVSDVFVSSTGYFIYKLKSKETLPMDQVRNEIKEALQTQRLQDAMDGVLDSGSWLLDEGYFAQ